MSASTTLLVNAVFWGIIGLLLFVLPIAFYIREFKGAAANQLSTFDKVAKVLLLHVFLVFVIIIFGLLINVIFAADDLQPKSAIRLFFTGGPNTAQVTQPVWDLWENVGFLTTDTGNASVDLENSAQNSWIAWIKMIVLLYKLYALFAPIVLLFSFYGYLFKSNAGSPSYTSKSEVIHTILSALFVYLSGILLFYIHTSLSWAAIQSIGELSGMTFFDMLRDFWKGLI
jgi:hypothetical protein